MCRQAFVPSAVPLVGKSAPHAGARADASTCPVQQQLHDKQQQQKQQQEQQEERLVPVRIAYELHGCGPVHVLLVPGMCVSRRMWDAQLEEFAKYPEIYSVCLLDNRGSGQSDIPPAALLNGDQNANYAIDTLARDAWAVADHAFGPTAKVHIAGHSMGSMIAQRIALLNLDRVASLALLSGNAGGWFWSNFPTLELVHAAIDLIRTGFHEHVAAEVSLRLHFTNRFLSEHVIDEESGEKRMRRDQYRMRYLHGIRRDAARDENGSVFWGHLAAVRSHNLTREEAEALRNASFEKIVIFGEEDRVVPPEASKDLARRIGATVRSVRGAHFIVDESAHEVNAALGELWKACPLPEPSHHFILDSYIVRSLAACKFWPAQSFAL